MRYGSIYVATNTVTGEQYVGQTRQRVERRWKCHVNTANSVVAKKHKLSNAILQYGKDVIKFEEIYAAFDSEELDAAEMNYIDWFKPAYNKTKGGAGHRVVECSDDLKKSRAARMAALWADPEWKAAQILKLKAAHDNDAARERGRKISSIGAAVRWAGHEKKQKRDRLVGIAIGARKKWKPVYCEELQVTFLSNKHAAAYLEVDDTTVCKVIKNKGKVKRLFTLVRVNQNQLL
jgi:group I intron endonuclease